MGRCRNCEIQLAII